jgi:hypothetical protein
MALNEINYIMLLAVAQKFVSATGAEAGVLETGGRTLIQAEDWGMKIGLAFLALGHLLYAILFVSSGAVPSALGWFGILASILAAGGILLNLITRLLAWPPFSPLSPMSLFMVSGYCSEGDSSWRCETFTRSLTPKFQLRE